MNIECRTNYNLLIDILYYVFKYYINKEPIISESTFTRKPVLYLSPILPNMTCHGMPGPVIFLEAVVGQEVPGGQVDEAWRMDEWWSGGFW